MNKKVGEEMKFPGGSGGDEDDMILERMTDMESVLDTHDNLADHFRGY